MKGIIFNIQRYSIHDGPGIRTTVFVKGCPLKCPWCSNPEPQNFRPEVAHRDSLCNRCGRCVEVCPEQAISIDARGVHIDRKRCNNCGKCVDVCSLGALKIFGSEISVEEVFQEVQKDMQYYRNSDGGVTVSGGEPLCQPDFTAAVLKQCQGEGIHTCLDTSGYGDTAALEEVLRYCSLVLFDLKHTDATVHRRLIKRSNDLIIRNLEFIIDSGKPTIIRVPLVPSINDSDEELKSIARIAARLKEPRVDLLPYHRYGVSKYKMLDRVYRLNKLERLKDTELQRAKEIFKSFSIECDVV